MCLFGKKYVGLDIADGSLEVAMVKDAFGRGKVFSLGRTKIEVGIVEKGRIKDSAKLALAIEEVMAKAKPEAIKIKEINFGLPESQTFIRHAYLPVHNHKERQGLIEKELLENIPISKNDLIYSYRVLKETKEGIEILIVASRKEIVEEWLKFFKSLKLETKNLDIEILATFRDLFTNLPKEPVMVLDIGSTTTLVGIFDEHGLHYEYIINIAGNDFTQTIAKAMDLDFVKAEAEKIKSGLKSHNKKVVGALEIELAKITEEIKQSFVDYKTETGRAVAEIVLVGGSSMLIGLVEYFSKALGLTVEIGKARSVNEKTPLFYIEAIGLALRGIEKHWDRTDPDIPKI